MTTFIMTGRYSAESEAFKASIALNKALGISFSTVPALYLEDFDKLVGGKG